MFPPLPLRPDRRARFAAPSVPASVAPPRRSGLVRKTPGPALSRPPTGGAPAGNADDGAEPARQGTERDAQSRQSPSSYVIYRAIQQEGEDELRRPSAALAWSALAAGLSMGFSFAAEALLTSHLPDAPWRPLVSKFGYCVGFLIVVLGRQQLYTENTLTVILPLLRRRDLPTLGNVGRLWGVVLGANLVGALLFAWVVAHSEVFDPAVRAQMAVLGQRAFDPGPVTILVRGVFAGWLIALMVWLLPFAENARFWVIIAVTYLVALGQFSHVVAGSVDTLYLVVTNARSAGDYLGAYLLPTLAGNVLGGVSLVAALAHAQVASEPGAGQAHKPRPAGPAPAAG